MERKGAKTKQTTIREAASGSRFVSQESHTAHFRATKLGAATQRKANDDSSAAEADGGVSQCGGVSGRAGTRRRHAHKSHPVAWLCR